MAELRYSELKYNGQTYTEQWKIDEILIKNKFNWMVNAEIKNARLEIFENTLVWNAGIWYNGSWYFGVWRDGEWRYGTWQNGVWYNGVWRDGTFKSGIIYKGKFFKGKIESGEIRGGQFISIEIDPKVVEYTEDEYQVKKQEEQKEVQQAAVATAQPTTPTNPDQVKVHSTLPAGQKQVTTQPKIQQEKLIIKFENFITESVNEYDEIDNRWFKLPYETRIKFLMDNFDVDKIEAYEICEPDTTIHELPNEILVDAVDSIREFLMTPLEKKAKKYNI